MSAKTAAYDLGPQDAPLPEQTIGAYFEATVAGHPEREALVEASTGRRWTYAQLNADVDAVARGLLAPEVDKGDRVGIWAPNSADGQSSNSRPRKSALFW